MRGVDDGVHDERKDGQSAVGAAPSVIEIAGAVFGRMKNAGEFIATSEKTLGGW